MAAFLAKQMVGNQFSSVKADISNETLTAEERSKMEEEERERLAALQEVEEIRKDKHRKMEFEREKMRQSVRQKYGIKKKEEKEAELRKQHEAEMAQHIAAMNPAGAASRSKSGSNASSSSDDKDFTAKLMNGNVSGAAIHVLSKMQSFIPIFKQE